MSKCPIDCGDNSCMCAERPLRGQRTNSGCRCKPYQLRTAVQWWRCKASETRAATVREFRDALQKWRDSGKDRYFAAMTLAEAFKLHSDPDGPPLTDPGKIEEAIWNLLGGKP